MVEIFGSVRKKRFRIVNFIESDENFTLRVDVKIIILDDFKYWFIDDWDFVIR